MKKPMFSVHDIKAQTFGNPFTSTNQNTAMRDFHAACNDQNSQLYKYPNDFTLYEVGEFDDYTGIIAEYTKIICLGPASDYNDNLFEMALKNAQKEV